MFSDILLECNCRIKMEMYNETNLNINSLSHFYKSYYYMLMCYIVFALDNMVRYPKLITIFISSMNLIRDNIY